MEKMNFKNNKNIKEAYKKWIYEKLESHDCEMWNVVLTFKQALIRDDGTLVALSHSEADKTVRYFLSKLNKAVYKNIYKRFNRRLIVADFQEGGFSNVNEKYGIPSEAQISNQSKHIHRHLLIEKPDAMTSDEFRLLIAVTWKRCDWARGRIYVEPVQSLEASSRYNMKSGGDAFVINNSNF